MKARSIIRNVSFGLLLCTVLSCGKKFLELETKRNTAAADAVIDIKSMQAAVNGMYSLLQSENYYGRTFIVVPELLSNNGMISIVNSARYTNINANSAVSTDTYYTGLWNILYQLAVNANLLIEKGEVLSLPEKDKGMQEQLLGEAYALRALAYFDLVRSFAQPYNKTPDASHAGVPIVVKSGTDVDDIIKPGRNSVAEVYDTIISDLQSSIERFLVHSSASSAVFSLYSAKALLSKVYLYKEDWENAEKEATDVINNGGYILLNNSILENGFRAKANSEVIFEVANNSSDNGGTNSLANFYSQLGYGDIIATEDLYKAYSATDVRRNFIAKSKRNRVGGEDPAYIISKYSNIIDFEENIKVLRLAEIYLIRAEARAKQTGKETESQDDLFLIARRGDVNAIRSTSTGEELVNVILTERRKELAFEGNQLFDLNRSGKSWTKYRSGAASISYTNQSNRTIYPIPRRETNLNPNISQNPGY